jgi:hypothetical protein
MYLNKGDCSSDVPTLYVFPIEKRELKLVTSTCTLSCNEVLHVYTRHTYLDSGAPEFGFSTPWLVSTPEVGDIARDFNDPSMLSAKMGARGCDGICR